MEDEIEIPAPDSAHEAVVRYLATGSEFSVVHTGTEGRAMEDRPGSRWYCQIRIVRDHHISLT